MMKFTDSPRHQPSEAAAYGLPLAFVGAAVALKYSLPMLSAPTLLLPSAVLLSAWKGGFRGGQVALVASTAAAIWLSWPAAEGNPGLLALQTVLFMAEMLFIAWVGASFRQSDLRAHESTHAVGETQRRYELVAKATNELVWEWDLRTYRIRWNDALERLYGYQPKEGEGATEWRYEHIHPDDRERVKSSLYQVISGKKSAWSQEYRFRRADGAYATVLDRAYISRDESGRAESMIGSLFDISVRVEAQEALRENQERFRLLTEAIPQIVFTAKPDGWIDYYNQRWSAYTGLGLDQTQGWGWQPVVHSGDLQNYLDRWERSMRAGDPFQVECRLKGAEGQYRWHLVRADPVRDRNGKIERWFGTCTDIDDQKSTEAELAESHRRMQSILESIGDAFFSIDRSWRFTYVNAVAERSLGRRRDELIGRDLWEALPFLSRASVRDALETTMRESRPTTFETTVETTAEPVRSLPPRWLEARAYGSAEGLSIYMRDVTEQHGAHEALRAAESRFRRLFDSNIIGIAVCDLQGRVFEVNDEQLRITGYSRQDFVSGNVTLRALTLPDSLPRDAKAVEQARTTGSCAPYEKEFRHKDGNPTTVLTAFAVLEGASERIIAVFQDLTERREFEDILKALGDAGAALSAAVDRDALLQAIAESAVPALADACAVEIFDGEDSHRVATAHRDPLMRQALRQAGVFEGVEELKRVRRTGRAVLKPSVSPRDAAADPERQLLLELGTRSALTAPLIARDRILGAMTFLANEGRRRYRDADVSWAEEIARRAALAVDNTRLYAEAQRASQLKDQFLSTLSHELRTPLNVILGWTEVLKSGNAGPDLVQKGLEAVTRNAMAQARLIDELLDASKIISGNLRLESRPVNFSDAVRAAAESVRLAASAKEIRLKTDFENAHEPVLGDANRLRQIAWALLTNAIKFTPQGGSVQATVRRPGRDRVELEVTDSGQGIDPAFLPHMFERFRQENRVGERKPGGMGLGLAIARQLVEAHGGSIEARSEGVGKGATFLVRLPLIPVKESPLGLMVPPASLSSPSTGALAMSGGLSGGGGTQLPASAQLLGHSEAVKRKARESERLADPALLKGVCVLLVDDSEDTCALGRLVLSRAGAKVITATSASMAIDKFKRVKPDVFVSDIGMPEEDGISLLQKVRALEVNDERKTPAAALTAYVKEEEARKILSAGFQMHLSKPIEPLQLVSAVASLSGRAPKA